MSRSALFAALSGLLLLALVLWFADLGAVATAIAGSGAAVVWMVGFRAVPLAIDALAWGLILDRARRPRFIHLWIARWIGESINTLLPVAQVGGDLARARLMSVRIARLTAPPDRAGFQQSPGGLAAAATMLDFILGLLTQAVFTISVVGLLIAVQRESASTGQELAGLVAGILLVTVGLVLLWRVIASGGFTILAVRLRRFAPESALARVAERSQDFSDALSTLHRRRASLARSAVLKTVAWCVRAGEIWIAGQALGLPIGPLEAVVIEGIASAARSAGFAIPGAVGIQEGGIVYAATLVGIPIEAALAIAVLKRAREVMGCLPALIVWVYAERRSLAALGRARSDRSPTEADCEDPERGPG